MKSMLFALIAAVLLPSSLIALTPETPVSAMLATRAAGAQRSPAAASDAEGNTVVVWIDERDRLQTCSSCTALYATRVDADGKPLTPFGVRLREGVYSARVASTGTNFLVVFSDRDGLWSWNLRADFTAVEDPLKIEGVSSIDALASNGAGFLAATQTSTGAVTLTQLERSGRPVLSLTLPRSALSAIATPRIAVIGGVYHVFRETSACDDPTSSACSFSTEETTTDGTGQFQTHTLDSNASQWFQIAAASGGNRMLVVWVTDVPTIDGLPRETVEFEIFDSSGHALSARKQVSKSAINSISATNVPAALWDGRSFLAMWQQPTSDAMQLVGVRITPDGTAIDASPLVLSQTYDGPLFAPSLEVAAQPRDSNLVVWSGGFTTAPPDIYGKTFRSVDNIVPSPGELVTFSPSQQTGAAVSGTTVAWREGDFQASIVARTGSGNPLFVAPGAPNTQRSVPAVQSRGDVSLVVWMESSGDGKVRTVARRIASGVLDSGSIVLAEQTRSGMSPWLSSRAVSVATDGDTFLVVWPGAKGGMTYGRRVAANGALLETAPFVIATVDPSQLGLVYVTRTAWTGQQYVVAMTNYHDTGILVALIQETIYLARVTRDGVALDANTPKLVSDAGWAAAPVSMAFGGGRLLLAWIRVDNTTACVNSLVLDANGNSVGQQRQVVCGDASSVLDTDVGWDGAEFVVATSERGADGHYTIRGRRMASDATYFSDPFEVSPSGNDAFDVALTGTTGGAFVAYTRVTPDGGYVGRVYTRTIEPLPRRRRAV